MQVKIKYRIIKEKSDFAKIKQLIMQCEAIYIY